MLKLKFQYIDHLMWKAVSLENTQMLNLSKFWEIVEDRGAWHATVHGVTKNQKQLSDWVTAITITAQTIFTVQIP